MNISLFIINCIEKTKIKEKRGREWPLFKNSLTMKIKLVSSMKTVMSKELRLFNLFPVWPDLAKFRHFGKKIQALLTVYFLFGKMLSLLWQICDIIGLIFSVGNDQIFLKYSNHLVTLLISKSTRCHRRRSWCKRWSTSSCWIHRWARGNS